MPLHQTYSQESFTVAVWKVEESIDELRAMFADFSPYEEAFSRFTSAKRKLEWLAVRALLKELCGEEKDIVYLPSGKPCLKEGSASVSFSHTPGYVAVAYSEKGEVAVDIEQYGTRVQRVAPKFIRDDERISVQAGDETYALLLHWSAKETLFKLLDEEGVDFIKHLHILPFVPSSEGRMLAEEYRTDKHSSLPIHYHTHPDFVLTYAFMPW